MYKSSYRTHYFFDMDKHCFKGHGDSKNWPAALFIPSPTKFSGGRGLWMMSLCDMEGGSGVLYIQNDSEWGVCTVWLWEHAAQNRWPLSRSSCFCSSICRPPPPTPHMQTQTHTSSFLSPIVSLSLLTWGEQTATAAAYNFALAAHVGQFGGF